MLASTSRATQKDIAARTGVGRSTVSLILTGRGDELRIPQATQKKVYQAAEKLEYRPNSLASGLVGKRTQTIGLLFPSSFFFPQNLLPQGISLRLNRQEYQTYLVDSLNDVGVIRDALLEMASRRVDGVVLYTTRHLLKPEIRDLLNKFPVAILMSHEPLPRESLRSHMIFENIASGVDEVVDHLVKTGRRRPMMLVNQSPGNTCRLAAFKNALRRHGLDSSDDAAVFGIPRCAAGMYDYFAYFMEHFESQRLEDREFDALFCTSDEGASAAIRYLKKRGIHVPQDIAVVGTNNAPWTQAIEPPLASISWRHVDASELVVKRLRERLDAPDLAPGCDELPTRFIWRESGG
ncbi:MAG: LacI family DNA-binding transcriptional regulator [Phycisphaerae bacterium]|nr:LacI family DNA-binding transcriptional regulator [Phycisphaerae bacterium]